MANFTIPAEPVLGTSKSWRAAELNTMTATYKGNVYDWLIEAGTVFQFSWPIGAKFVLNPNAPEHVVFAYFHDAALKWRDRDGKLLSRWWCSRFAADRSRHMFTTRRQRWRLFAITYATALWTDITTRLDGGFFHGRKEP